MAGNGTIKAKPDTLMEEHEKLKKESTSKIAKNPPLKSGSGYMANQLDEMVINVQELHTKAIELVNSTSNMLKKIGIELEDMDKTSAGIYEKIN